MNGRIMNCAPGGARLANKVFPVPRLIPRRGNPREPLAAGIGRGKFYSECVIKNKTMSYNERGGGKAAQYAKAFLGALRSGSDEEAKDRVLGLVRALKKRGETRLLPNILAEVQTLSAHEEKKDRVLVTMTERKADTRYEKEIARATRAVGAEKKERDSAIDPALIGGFRVSYKGMLYDASYRKQLLNLYRKMTLS